MEEAVMTTMVRLNPFKVRIAVVAALAAATLGISGLVAAPSASAMPVSERCENLQRIYEADLGLMHLWQDIYDVSGSAGDESRSIYWANKAISDGHLWTRECLNLG
jgi:hypothetical protein